MHRIQVEIPDRLAEKLAPHRDRLPELLELGLQVWLEGKEQERVVTHEGLLHALAASGKVTLPQPYRGEKPYGRHTPVPITGKPVSRIIIEQRGAL